MAYSYLRILKSRQDVTKLILMFHILNNYGLCEARRWIEAEYVTSIQFIDPKQ